MEELRQWFLIMVFLHRQAIPTHAGGNPSFYSDVMMAWADSEQDTRVCAPVVHLYQRLRKKILVPRDIRVAFEKDTPFLVTELPSQRGVALFTLTPDGEKHAQQLVADLSEGCQATIKASLLEMQRKKSKARHSD